jgi:hypothetical protein
MISVGKANMLDSDDFSSHNEMLKKEARLVCLFSLARMMLAPAKPGRD